MSEREPAPAIIEALYVKLYHRLLAYATANVHNRAIAEELTQEAFTIACEHPDKLTGSHNPEGWLVVVLKNLISNYNHRRALWAKITELDYESAVVGMHVTDSMDLRLLYRGIVPDEDLDLIISVEVDGLTYKEAAGRVGISAEACRKRVKRAEKVFFEKLSRFEKICPVYITPKHDVKGGLKNVE